MVKLIFIVKGERKEVEVPVGTTVLEAARQNNIPLEGNCGGALACAACHVIVDKEDFSKLPVASEKEEDLLDLVLGLTPASRLGCQIVMTEELNGLTITIPDKGNS